MKYRPVVSLVTLLMSAVSLHAEPTIEQLRSLYEESQRQLQQSQDRKNQLASENEQLKSRIADLENELRSIAARAQQDQFLRNQVAAWRSFLQQYPALFARFETYVTGNSGMTQSLPASVPMSVSFYDPQWPFSAADDADWLPSP